MVRIREATEEDYAAICRLNFDEMGYEYSPEETKHKLRKLLGQESDKILVAVLSGEVVGYIHANDYDVLYMGHMKNIMGIAVRADCKRNGIGRALLREIEEWAKEDGAAGVRLVSGITRTGAHEFYRRCGYGEGREQKNLKKILGNCETSSQLPIIE